MRATRSTKRWFDVPDDPDKTRICVKHLTLAELIDINDRASVQETRYVHNEKGELVPEMINRSNVSDVRIAEFCAAVVDWENMFDENGEPMECTDENKKKAMLTVDGLLAFVGECRAKLANDIAAEKKEQEKN